MFVLQHWSVFFCANNSPVCLQECWYTKKSQLVVRKGRGADEELGRTSSQVGEELDKREPRKTTAAPW